MATTKKHNLKTKDIAAYTMEINDTPEETIKKIWVYCGTGYDKHDAFVEFRELVKDAIRIKYGSVMLKRVSNQFIGYAAHYIFAYCVRTYGRCLEKI